MLQEQAQRQDILTNPSHYDFPPSDSGLFQLNSSPQQSFDQPHPQFQSQSSARRPPMPIQHSIDTPMVQRSRKLHLSSGNEDLLLKVVEKVCSGRTWAEIAEALPLSSQHRPKKLQNLCQSGLKRVSRFLACLLPNSVNTLSGQEYYERYLRTPQHLFLLSERHQIKIDQLVCKDFKTVESVLELIEWEKKSRSIESVMNERLKRIVKDVIEISSDIKQVYEVAKQGFKEKRKQTRKGKSKHTSDSTEGKFFARSTPPVEKLSSSGCLHTLNKQNSFASQLTDLSDLFNSEECSLEYRLWPIEHQLSPLY